MATVAVGRGIPQLHSNGMALSMAPERFGWLVPADPAAPMAELRDTFRAQGYLWLRGVLDRRAVLDFRARYFSAMAEAGLIAPGSPPAEGRYGGATADRRRAAALVVDIVRWARYEAFCMAAPILDFYEAFLQGPVFLHKRKLIRHTCPGDAHATGAHYDLVYLREGTDALCTSWIPIGDTPVEMGGLCYLEGSDGWARALERHHGREHADLPREDRARAFGQYMASGWLTKDLAALADDTGLRWLVADYGAGDMVVHSPYMIHASTANIDPLHRVRLSTDIRYQRLADPIDRRWQNHWSPDDGL